MKFKCPFIVKKTVTSSHATSSVSLKEKDYNTIGAARYSANFMAECGFHDTVIVFLFYQNIFIMFAVSYQVWI